MPLFQYLFQYTPILSTIERFQINRIYMYNQYIQKYTRKQPMMPSTLRELWCYRQSVVIMCIHAIRALKLMRGWFYGTM